MEITLSLSDDLIAKAGTLAKRSDRAIEDVLSETLSYAISSIGSLSSDSMPWKQRSNDEVLRLCELELPPDTDRQLSTLLKKQREEDLKEVERTQLTALMRRYEDGLLMKAEALREAVKRGLRPPLDS